MFSLRLRQAHPETPDVPKPTFSKRIRPTYSLSAVLKPLPDLKARDPKCISNISHGTVNCSLFMLLSSNAQTVETYKTDKKKGGGNHSSPIPENPGSTLTLPVTSPVGNNPASKGTPATLPSLACRTRVRSEPRGCSMFSLGGAGHI